MEISKVKRKCSLQPDQGKVRSDLFKHAKIIDEQVNENGGWELFVEIDKKYLGLLKNVRVDEV